ncbi:MAG: site-specific DNA-methyltransferase [Desulfobulbus sp.]
MVGVEAEDLSRHDKWLCMMYPRLRLLKDFLREDGVIFISIDDNEVTSLRFLLDEIFGRKNFIASVIWQKVYAPKNSAKHFSEDHDFILVYARNGEKWCPNPIPRSEEADRRYNNPDNDPRGPWKTSDLSARNFYSEGTYPITCPSGRIIPGPPKGRYWIYSEEKYKEMDADNRIWWGKTGNNMPAVKRFLSEVKQGIVPQTLWSYKDVGHTQDAKKELLSLVEFEDSASVFITPKPVNLIRRIIQIATDKDSIIMDSFAGSGTTGQAVLAQNKADGGTRKCILVEMDENICSGVTVPRLKSVVEGYKKKGKTSSSEVNVPGLGSGFKYCSLGETLFDNTGQIAQTVSFIDLARFVFFKETGQPLPDEVSGITPLIGIHNNTAVYVLYNGILSDKTPQGGNALTRAVLAGLPPHEGIKVVYGTSCRVGPVRLKRENVLFRQIPYDLKFLSCPNSPLLGL